jgi:PhnB protein
MKISIHLSFNGNCEEAFAMYARLLDGQVVYSLRYRDSPASAQVPPDWQDKLFHSTLTIGDVTLLGGDLVDFHNAPQGFALVLNPASRDEAEVLFDALAERGEVAMPLQATSWASAFGVLTDRFGVPWEINCEEPQEAA